MAARTPTPVLVPKVAALAQWYGSNRSLGDEVGRQLAGCLWVGVPFAGGMCELPYIPDARTVVVSDLHCHVMNLAAVVRDRHACGLLQERLRATPHHERVLSQAQRFCAGVEAGRVNPQGQVNWAWNYFVSVWSSRGGDAGTAREFDAAQSVRWEPAGGDSALRFRSAAEALTDWQTVMWRCTFTCQDVFAFLPKVKDRRKHGLYLDPPFPGHGEKYKHPFGVSQHRLLAAALERFTMTRVVLRFYDHPLVRELYPERVKGRKGGWRWVRLPGGKRRTNRDAVELLLVKNG